MDSMERYKLRLQLAANTKNVRIGQTRDYLLWQGEFPDLQSVEYDEDGNVFLRWNFDTWVSGRRYVFIYPDGNVREIFIGEDGWSVPYSSFEGFEEEVKSWSSGGSS